MSLTFNGTTDYVKLAVGTSTAFQQGTYSFAACVKKRSGSNDANPGGIFASGTVGGTGVHEFSDAGGANGVAMWNGTAQVQDSTHHITKTDGWVITGVDKTSAGTPRAHLYNFGTTAQSHTNMSGALANSASPIGAGGFWWVGASYVPDEFWDGDIAWVAVWDSTQLADADYVTMQSGLTAVQGLSPTHLWVMTTTGIVDVMGNGANESSRSGTTAGSTPPTGHASILTVIDLGDFETAEWASITMSMNSAGTTSPAAGSLLVVPVMIDGVHDGLSAGVDASFAVTDNIGDTGGTAWSHLDGTGTVMRCTRGPVTGAQFFENTEIWWRLVGTTPGASKTITVNVTCDGLTTSTNCWGWMQVIECRSQHPTTPIGTSTGVTARTATGISSLAATLGASPAASSAVILSLHDDRSAVLATAPTGYSNLQSISSPAPNDSTVQAAYRIGGTTSTPTWLSLDTTGAYLFNGVEIVAAPTAVAPSTITIVRAVAETSAASLVWNVPADNGSAITDYLIEYNPAGAGWFTFTHTASTNAYVFVTGLTPGISYTFRISAINSAGTGTASAASEAATPLGTHTIAHLFAPLQGDVIGHVLSSPSLGRPDSRQQTKYWMAGVNTAEGTVADSTGSNVDDDFLWGPALVLELMFISQAIQRSAVR